MRNYPKWAVLGRLAAIVLRQSQGGSRLARENELAASVGLSRSTLRHYRDAVENVRGIEDWALRRRLMIGTAVAANTIVRWMRRDAAAASMFLARNPDFTDAQIVAAARKVDPAHSGPNWADWPLATLLADAVQVGGHLNADLTIDKYAPDPDPCRFHKEYLAKKPENAAADFLGIEFELIQTFVPINELEKAGETEPPKPEDRLVAAMMPISRFVLLERYRQEARTLWPRLVAASLVYPIVIAVFPGPAARRHFAAGIPDSIRASWTGQRRVGEWRGRKCRSQLISFRLSPQAGRIVLSTRPGLAVDLFEDARERDLLPGSAPGLSSGASRRQRG